MLHHSAGDRAYKASTQTEPASQDAATTTQPETLADAQAAANIAEWRKYLPEDCVESMIQAGWHRVV